jgi:hypothetical protein
LSPAGTGDAQCTIDGTIGGGLEVEADGVDVALALALAAGELLGLVCAVGFDPPPQAATVSINPRTAAPARTR